MVESVMVYSLGASLGLQHEKPLDNRRLWRSWQTKEGLTRSALAQTLRRFSLLRKESVYLIDAAW